MGGEFCQQFFSVGQFKIVKVEARCDGSAEESEFAFIFEEAALPGVSRDNCLNAMAFQNVRAESDDFGFAVWEKQEHSNGVAEIEVEDFIVFESVEF